MLITWSVFPLVTIEDPCTDNHKYTLGRDGLIVIKADGNKFFTGSCVVTLRAEDPRYQCSKLCFTVDSFKFQVCNLRLAFYDTGVWNYGSAAPSWVSGKLHTCTVLPFHSSSYSLRFHVLWGLFHVLLTVERISWFTIWIQIEILEDE